MRPKSFILFAIASIILLSFTFISNSSVDTKKVNNTNIESIGVKDSHGGLVMEDPNQWD